MTAPAPSHPISLFGCRAWHFPVPATFDAAIARSRGPGRRVAPARGRAFLEGGEPGGRLPRRGWRDAAAAVGLMACLLVSGLALPAAASPDDTRTSLAVKEAAQRFALPEAWIRAVIDAESGGRPAAVSVAGAVGLMQLMPGTWSELRRSLGLGPDPFDVRDNILAGSAYLRRMLDRYGEAGFLAAYNAGPARYEAWISSARSLPPETHAYVAALARRLGVPRLPETSAARTTADWRRSGLFHNPPTSGSDPGSADAPAGRSGGLFGVTRTAGAPP